MRTIRKINHLRMQIAAKYGKIYANPQPAATGFADPSSGRDILRLAHTVYIFKCFYGGLSTIITALERPAMQRDWDLVRKILLKLEEIGNTTSLLEPNQVNGYDPEVVSYHMQRLDEAGLIKARLLERWESPCTV